MQFEIRLWHQDFYHSSIVWKALLFLMENCGLFKTKAIRLFYISVFSFEIDGCVRATLFPSFFLVNYPALMIYHFYNIGLP